MSTQTRMALVYDFDGTLAPGHMQNRQFIPDTIGMEVGEFWAEVNQRAWAHEADPILTYMYVMLEKCREAGVQVRRQDLAVRSEETRFFPGVEEWFDRTTNYARLRGIELQHYCISFSSDGVDSTYAPGRPIRLMVRGSVPSVSVSALCPASNLSIPYSAYTAVVPAKSLPVLDTGAVLSSTQVLGSATPADTASAASSRRQTETPSSW